MVRFRTRQVLPVAWVSIVPGGPGRLLTILLSAALSLAPTGNAQENAVIQTDGSSLKNDSRVNQTVPDEFIVLHAAEPAINAALRSTSTKAFDNLSTSEKSTLRTVIQKAVAAIEIERNNLASALTKAGKVPQLSIKRKLSLLSSATVLQGIDRSTAQTLAGRGFDIRPVELYSVSLNRSVDYIGASSVWQQTDSNGNAITGSGVHVAVIDTGIDWTHPAFGSCTEAQFVQSLCPRMSGKNFVNPSLPPFDENKHGTHVAGIIAANGSTPGVAPGVFVHSLKVCNKSGTCPSDAILNALEYAADPNGDGDFFDHLDVVNLSLGGVGSPDDLLSQAVDRTVSAGVVVVASAGNSGPGNYSINSPGTARSAITVGAMNSLIGASSDVASFSSRGPVVLDQGNKLLIKPDLVAPGTNICAPMATWFAPGPYQNCLPGYMYLSGTSMAAPHITGVAALILQAHPDWSPSQVKSALKSTTTELIDGYTEAARSILEQGSGAVNAADAVNASGAVLEIDSSVILMSDIVPINGTVTMPGLQEYRFECRESALSPWIELFRGTTSIEKGVLGTIDPALMRSGNIECRLAATSAQHSERVYTIIRIESSAIKSPEDHSNKIHKFSLRSLNGRSRIPIIGNSLGSQFASYEIALCDKNNTTCSSAGIELANSGTQPVNHGILGYLEPAKVSQISSGQYLIKLTTHRLDSSTDIAVSLVYIDMALAENYPISYPNAYLDSTNTWYISFSDQPVIADINRDGRDEMIFNYKGVVDIKDKDFNSLTGWPRSVESTRNQTPITVADMDGDDSPDLVAFISESKNVWAFNNRGSTFPGFPHRGLFNLVPYKPNTWAARTLADVNGDGLRDIISPDLYAENLMQEQPDGWLPQNRGTTPHEISPISSYSPAIGDLNADGKNETIVTTFNNSDSNFVRAFDRNGQTIWEAAVPSALPSEPILGDLDGDGLLEVVLVDGTQTNQVVYVFNHDGTTRSGWPFTLPATTYNLDTRTVPASIADIDNDGKDEIFIANGWCISILGDGGTHRSRICHDRFAISGIITVANLDTDPELEILPARTYAGLKNLGINFAYEIDAFNEDGSDVEGFPKVVPGIAPLSQHIPVADLDGDGKNEVVHIGGEHLYVWKTAGATGPNRGWNGNGGSAQGARNQRLREDIRPFIPGPSPKIDVLSVKARGKSLSSSGGVLTFDVRLQVTPTQLVEQLTGNLQLKLGNTERSTYRPLIFKKSSSGEAVATGRVQFPKNKGRSRVVHEVYLNAQVPGVQENRLIRSFVLPPAAKAVPKK